jgi:hypothetical protein
MLGLLSAAALALGVQQAGAANIDVYNGIGADTTWSSANVYRLMEPVFVTNGATLTIQAGTVIQGEANSTPPGVLIIARGAKINAQGTAANPIVFTAEGDDNIGGNPGTGVWAQKNNGIGKKWGGVILLGRTFLATDIGLPGTPSPNAALTVQIEGLDSYGEFSKYGGGNDDDNSGEMHYCSIRYGAFVLGTANEINGLTLGGVGRGTQLDHIEIFQNADDDVEFFGGTVNLKYVVAWNSTDDGFDTDEGYRGKGQFMFRVQGPLSTINEISDKGTEEDGAMGMLSQPSGCPMFYNMTQVGLGKETGNKANSGIMLREGTGFRMYNSLWMDFGGAPGLIQGSPVNATAGESADKFVQNYVNNAYYTHEAIGLDGVQAKLGEMKYNVFYKFATNVFPAIPVDAGNTLAKAWGANDGHPVGTLAGSWDWYGYPAFSDASLKNFYLDEVAFTTPVSSIVRSPVGFVKSGKTYYPVDSINPLPRPGYDGALMTFGRVPPNDGFYTPVNFIGAFGKTKNWAQGWSLASRLGLIANATAGDYTGVVPGIRVNGAQVEVKLDGDVYQGIPADLYVIFETTPGTFYILPTLNVNAVPWNGAQVTAAAFPLPATPGIGWTAVCSTANRPAGTTRSYFVADMVPGNGILDLAQLYFATIP